MFAVALSCAMAVTIGQYYEFYNQNIASVWFFATYACIGVIVSLFFDWMIGALLCVVSLASAAHVLGYISIGSRDILGEISFILCLIAASFSRPADGITGWRFPFTVRGRTNPNNGDSQILG